MDVRGKILKAAAELFLKYGIKSVSIDEICKELHISKKTFYLYFRQKEDLIEDLLREMRTKKHAGYKPLDRDENLIDAMWRNLNVLKADSMMEKHINFFYDLQKFYPEIAQRHNQEMDHYVLSHIREGLQRGIDQGYFRKEMDVFAVSVFMNVRFSSLMRELRESTNMNTAQAVDFISDTFIRVVANEKGLAYFYSKKEEVKQTKEIKTKR